VDAHLACCAACLEKLELERTVNDLLGELPILQPSDDFTDRVMHSIAAAEKTKLGPVTSPGHKGYSQWKVEAAHGVVAFAGTYMFIASGTLHRIVNQWAGSFSFSVQVTVTGTMTFSTKWLDCIASLVHHLS
jgi:hypothetical protein